MQYQDPSMQVPMQPNMGMGVPVGQAQVYPVMQQPGMIQQPIQQNTTTTNNITVI